MVDFEFDDRLGLLLGSSGTVFPDGSQLQRMVTSMKRRLRQSLIHDLRDKLCDAVMNGDYALVTRLATYLSVLTQQESSPPPDPLPALWRRLERQWVAPFSGRRLAPDLPAGTFLEAETQDRPYRIVVGETGLLYQGQAYTSLNHLADSLFGAGRGMRLRYLENWRVPPSKKRRN